MQPIRQETFINTNAAALQYGLTVIGTFWVASFAFSGYFPQGIAIGCGSIVLGTALMVWMVRRNRNKKRTFTLTDEGIRETRTDGDTFIAWEEFHQTYFRGTSFSSFGLPLADVSSTQVLTKDRSIRINQGSGPFHDTLLRLSHRHVLPQINQRIARGETVPFGPVALSQDQVTVKGKPYDRRLLRSVAVENGAVKIRLQEKWFGTKIPVDEIPNFLCLVDLLSAKE